MGSFFLLAFAFTWANWVPRALRSRELIDAEVPAFMFLVAGYGPAAAAIITTMAVSGMAGLREIGRRLLLWRVGIRWYVIVLCLPAALAFTGMGFHWVFGGEIETMRRVDAPGSPLWQRFLLLALMFTLGFDGVGEELGWRGFALPQLLRRHSALVASLIMGALWALWHLPYALTTESAMSGRPFYEYLPGMFATSILFTWVFIHTRESILLAILFHAAGNVTVNVLPELWPGFYNTGVWGTITPWLLVMIILSAERGMWLAWRNVDLGPFDVREEKAVLIK